MGQIKISQVNENYNSKNVISKIAKTVNEEIEVNDKEKNFVYDEVIIVGDEPKKFYYNYDNDQYYFTAKNAKFEITINGEIKWYYGEWLDGFFRDGLWIDGHWHNGTFCRGNWLDGQWDAGNWYEGEINGSKSEKHP